MRLKQIILPLLFINLFLFFTADSEASSYVAQPPANNLYLTPIKGTKKKYYGTGQYIILFTDSKKLKEK